MPDNASAKRLVERYYDMWNSGRGTEADELLAPTYLDHAHPGVIGPAATRALVPRFHAANDGFFKAEVVASSDDFVAVRRALKRVQKGEPVVSRGIAVFRISEGRLAEQWSWTEPGRESQANDASVPSAVTEEVPVSQPTQELPPPAVLMQLLSGSMVAQAISTCAELAVADHLESTPRTAAEIAPEIGAHAPSLHRLMRALAMVGVLEEHEGERFTLTPVGRCLRSDAPGSQRGMARMLGRTWRMTVLAELTHCVRTGESGFPKVYGKGPFDWFTEHPEEGAVFDDAMTAGSAPTADGVARSYDFSAFERVAEIGGGHGALLTAILRAHPRLKGVLFDLPHVAAGAKQRLEAAGLSSRAEVVGGSFFESVPAGCDAYVMKHIIHDWSDDRSVAILRRCREAMRPGGKVLVVDSVVPGRGVPSFAKLLDLQMLVMNEGGKERTEGEFAELFTKAGLRLLRVVPTPYRVSIVEGAAAT